MSTEFLSVAKADLVDLPEQKYHPFLTFDPGENFWFTEKFFHFN